MAVKSTIEVEFNRLRKKGERRRWSRTPVKVLIGSNVHRAVLGEEGPYFDFLRVMYRLPKESNK